MISPIDPPDPKKQTDHIGESQLISYLTLRRTLGWIGLGLPVALLALGLALDQDLYTSISAYYHSDLRELMVGALCAVGIFLIAYRGYDLKEEHNLTFSDHATANAAGIGAIGVALLPTAMETTAVTLPPHWEAGNSLGILGDPLQWVLSLATAKTVIGVLHLGSALLFFAAIAYLLFRHFPLELKVTLEVVTQQAKQADRKLTAEEERLIAIKERRKRAYHRCGKVIIAMIVLLVLDAAWDYFDVAPQTYAAYAEYRPVFWFEAIAVWAFAYGWLVKGRQLYDDRPIKAKVRAA
jgi:hypothetical protein